MAGADPRRSSRARTSQSQSQSQSQVSSTTSSTSGRVERSTRALSKGGSPQKSTPTGSLSSEPPEDAIATEDPFASRRRTRGQNEERDRTSGKRESVDMANGDEEIQEEDEAVRCICGFDDYPGPPPFDEDSKYGVKDAPGIDPIFATDVTDDAAGFFVQCDICKVWQHGACVGIMTEESSPDEYFCEECRKDLHKIFTASNGQRYSHYLPLKRLSRTTSRATSLNKDSRGSPPKEKEARNGRTSSANQTSKRRSTMNSRDAAYDEAEALKRAIEASKEDALPEQADNNTRRAKRGRSDSSEDKQESVKRQRTSSRSLSPPLDKAEEDSDEEVVTARNGSSKSKARSNPAVRNLRAEKAAEKEERERQRAEAANKRRGRAERRRADDSDPSEELPLATRTATSRTATVVTTTTATTATTAAAAASAMTAAITPTSTSGSSSVTNAPGVASATNAPSATSATNKTTTETTPANLPADMPPPPVATAPPEPPPPSQLTPDTPPASAVATKNDKKRSHKKKGRNQYTRDRDGHEENSPARSQSRDLQRDEPTPSGVHKASGGDSHGKSNSKAKGGMGSKVTMSELKRRATAMLEYISRKQLDLAGETTPDMSSDKTSSSSSSSSSSGSTNGGSSSGSRHNTNGDSSARTLQMNGGEPSAAHGQNHEGGDGIVPAKEFHDLNSTEMMDILTRRLVKWQQEYAA